MPTGDHPLRILLTEGSSLSARQTVYALGRCGHVLDVCDPRRLSCLSRYSRYVRKFYRCPSFTADPAGYVRFLEERLDAEPYDVLLPVHDQVFLLARVRERFERRVGLAVPEFPAVERLQSKAGLVRLLDELGLPYPATVIVQSRRELEEAATGPCYVKLAYGTAGCGVWRVEGREDLRGVADQLEVAGLLDGETETLVQRPAAGVLCVAQSVFQHGRLVGAHCYQARALGVGGSARARVGVSHPLVLDHLAVIGRHLAWHGALMLDYLHDPATGRPAYIDANPRLGETLNATLSGVNLAELLVQVSRGHPVADAQPSRAGVRTHSVLMTLLAAAEQGRSRGYLLAELARATLHIGLYAGSGDEITRPWEDPPSLVPAAFLTARLLLKPRAAHGLIRRAVDNYALSEAAVRAIRRLTPDSSQRHSLPRLDAAPVVAR